MDEEVSMLLVAICFRIVITIIVCYTIYECVKLFI